VIKELARFATGLMPQEVRARIARYRFGYSGAGRAIPLSRAPGPPGCFEVRLGAGPRFMLTDDLAQDFATHFTEPGDCAAEMAAFLAASLASGPSSCFIDVGSNRGLFSLLHLAAGDTHRAVLVDPSGLLCGQAAALLRLNGVLGRAEILTAGAAETGSTRRIVTDALGYARVAGGQKGHDVPFLSIDELCAGRGLSPAMVKIDVEGAEADVLRGAVQTLHAHRPLLFLELHFDMLEQVGERVGDLLGSLVVLGYRFETTRGVPLPRWQLQRSLMAVQRVVARPGPVR